MPEPFHARFEYALHSLGIGQTSRLLLAISGGPDSLALLLLAHEAMPGRIAAATVDHGLRPEAAAEAAYVAEVCSRFAVPHSILAPAQPITGNLQSSARAARYALLEAAADAHGCTQIATAHHGDDQLETLLMRLARGSGVAGMAGIRARNGRIVRPLLGFAKAELEAICAAAGIEPVRDPSNDDWDFDRVRMRQWLAQLRHPFDPGRIQRTAGAMAQANEALAWSADRLAGERVVRDGDAIALDASGLPAEYRRRLVLHCLALADPALATKGDAIDRLLAELHAGRTATIGNILCEGGERWTFSPAPPRRKIITLKEIRK